MTDGNSERVKVGIGSDLQFCGGGVKEAATTGDWKKLPAEIKCLYAKIPLVYAKVSDFNSSTEALHEVRKKVEELGKEGMVVFCTYVQPWWLPDYVVASMVDPNDESHSKRNEESDEVQNLRNQVNCLRNEIDTLKRDKTQISEKRDELAKELRETSIEHENLKEKVEENLGGLSDDLQYGLNMIKDIKSCAQPKAKGDKKDG